MTDGSIGDLLRRAMLDSPVGLGLTNPEGTFREVNRTLCEMVGFEPDEMRTMNWRDIVMPEDRPRMEVLLEQILNGSLDHFDTRLRLQYLDGSPRYTRTTLNVLRDDSGAPEMLCLQFLDTTHETLLDETLHLLAAQGSDVMVRADNNGMVTWISPNVQTMTGWLPGQLQGTSFLSLIHPDDRPEVRLTQQAALSGQSRRMDVRLMCADSRFATLSIQVDPVFGPEGELLGRVATWRRQSQDQPTDCGQVP